MKIVKDSIWLIAIGVVCVLGILKLSDGKASISDINNLKNNMATIEHRFDRLENKIDDLMKILIKQ